MPVFVADDPLTCVVRGTGKLLKMRQSLIRLIHLQKYLDKENFSWKIFLENVKLL